MSRAKKHIKKTFETQYFFWGHLGGRPDAKGFSDDLTETYGNASRHLGRGSVYRRAVIVDREQEKIIDVLTRGSHGINFKEKL